MPIFHDRIADQIEELLPEFYQADGPRFISFLKAYFEFLEKGQLIYKDAADIDYIGLEDGTVAGEAFNTDGQRGNMLQEPGTYKPSSITNAKINYEHDVDSGGVQKTSFTSGEYVVGSSTGATGRIDVIGTSSNLYIEQFSEAQFDIDETITGMTSDMTAKVAQFKASPLHAANNLLSYADVDKTSGDFLEYFRRDFMPFIDRDILANKRLLQKHVKELYLAKGTKESYEFLFRILYGLEAEIAFPTENVIRPSESEFSQPTVMRLYSTHNLTKYVGGQITKYAGSVVLAQAWINKSSGVTGTNDGANGYEIQPILPHRGTFSPGDSVVISDRDGLRIDATGIVRGVMADIDPDESSIYVGIEDGEAGDLEDIIRVENPTSIYILNEDGDNILHEDGDSLSFEHSLHSEDYQVRPFGLETGTGVGSLLTEESVYDIDGNLITDYVLLDENTDFYDGMVTHNPEVRLIMESNENIQLEDAYGVLLSNDSQIPDQQWVDLQPSSRSMDGGLYGELASLGSLYVESDTFNYQSPAGGTATQSLNVIGGIGRGGITEVIIDDAGTSYSAEDPIVFLNTGTDGTLAEASIEVTEGNVTLESGTTPGIQTFTATANQVIFEGRDNEGRMLGFDPRKVEVYVEGTELTRETHFQTDQSGQKVTLIGTYASGQADALSNSDTVEIVASFRGLLLENALRPEKFDGVKQAFVDVPGYIANESSGAIKKVQITNPGVNYKALPQVFVGGHIYYDTMTTGTLFTVGEIIRESGSNGEMTVVSHDTDKKRLLVYKKTSDAAGVPSGTITGLSSGSVCSISQTNVTAGRLAKLWTWGDDIGSIKRLKMQNVGHDFDQGGIGNYKQHAIVKDNAAALVGSTKVTASLTGATATIHTFDGLKNMVTMKDVKGIFNNGDYCTTDESPAKTFFIAKINPATARGVLQGAATIDGNYTNDTGFPSVTSQRIHDGQVYQDFSYIIKVGRSINDYRSIIKSLLSPAGTIFFGEVAIRSLVDARAEIYNVHFDGIATTRAFVPTLIIGSRTDVADIALEDGTVPGGVMGLNQLTLTGTGATGVYTAISPEVPSGGTGLTVTLQLPTTTSYSNLQIITRGTDYIQGETVTITQAMVGGSGGTAFATFEISETGSPLETTSHLTFTNAANPIGKVELEDGQGVMSTERFLSIAHPLTPVKVFKDQASGIFYSTVPDEPPGAQGLIVSGPGADYTIIPQDRDFFNRYLMAEVSPKGYRVNKRLEIYPAYNQHKIYYTTLSNALAVGTKVRGATSNALGIVIKHDTTKNNAILRYTSVVSGTGVVGTYYNVTGVSSASGSGATFDITLDTTTSVSSIVIRNIGSGFVPNETITIQEKHVGGAGNDTDTFAVITVNKVDSDYIIVHRDQEDWGQAGSQFSGTEIIQNTAASINYFTATSIELNWTPEDIVTKREPAAITADTYITSQAQKTAAQGGAEPYTHVGGVVGFTGRGRNITSATDPSETYDSEMKQRKVTLVSSPLYTSSATQRGRSLSASNNTKTPFNQKGARTEGTNTIIAGDTSPPYLAINGTALRIDDIKNSVSELPGDSSVTIPLNANGSSRQGVNMSKGVNWGYRPAGQKLYESTNFVSERLIFEDEDNMVPEDHHGSIIGEYFGRDGIVLLEDGTEMLFETETTPEDTHYFVSEESTQIASYNLVGDNNDRIIDETSSKPIILEEALMAGQKESNQSGPSIGDLRNIMFSENYTIMQKVQQEGNTDDIMLETGEHLMVESLSEGLRISDISNIYPNRLVSNLERELGRKTNFNHSAVVQTG